MPITFSKTFFFFFLNNFATDLKISYAVLYKIKQVGSKIKLDHTELNYISKPIIQRILICAQGSSMIMCLLFTKANVSPPKWCKVHPALLQTDAETQINNRGTLVGLLECGV